MSNEAGSRPERPFLLQMAVRQRPQSVPPLRYDTDEEELLVLLDASWTPAIDADNVGPVTKKKDIERDEDEKDQW